MTEKSEPMDLLPQRTVEESGPVSKRSRLGATDDEVVVPAPSTAAGMGIVVPSPATGFRGVLSGVMSGEQAALMRLFLPPETADRFVLQITSRCELPIAPAVATDAHGNHIMPVVTGYHDLNLSKTYAHHIKGFQSSRELMQNWYDRTLEYLEGRPTRFHDPGWCDGRRVAFMERVCADESRPRCGGFILEQKLNGKVFIQLTNYATALSKDALIIGCSRKNSTDAAGAYGEGMKVEINCLVAKGAQVFVFTGSRIWNFMHRIEQGSSEPKLFMEAIESPACDHLSICILADEKIIPEVDRSKFLFLKTEQLSSHSGDDVVEILLDEQQHGKIYARGIYIMEPKNLKDIGLNFVGSLEMHKAFGFTRDRDSINLESLVAQLPMVVELLRQKKEVALLRVEAAAERKATDAMELKVVAEATKNVHESIVHRLYQILEHKGKSAVSKYLLSWCDWHNTLKMSAARTNLANELFQLFLVKNKVTLKPYPIYDRISKDDNECQLAVYLGCTLVPVSESLLKLLHMSSQCPTTKRLLKQHERKIYNADEWTPADEVQKMVADRYRNLFYQWFGDSLSPGMLVFKAFPRGNNHPVLVGRGPSGETILALDATLLGDANASHKWLQKEYGRSCIDPVSDGEGGLVCGSACTMCRFSQALIACLKTILPGRMHGDLEHQQAFSMFRMQARDLPVQAPPPAPEPPTLAPLADADKDKETPVVCESGDDVTDIVKTAAKKNADADDVVVDSKKNPTPQVVSPTVVQGCSDSQGKHLAGEPCVKPHIKPTTSVDLPPPAPLMPNIKKLCVVQQTSDRMMAPPPGRHILRDGGRGTHLPKGVHADEPEGTRCMEQVFNVKLGVFLPSEDSHDGFGPPECLQQLFEIFNEAVGMARSSFHTGRAQFFASWSPLADWLGLHHHDGLCLINIALVRTKADMIGVICHEMSHENESGHNVYFAKYLQRYLTEVINCCLGTAPDVNAIALNEDKVKVLPQCRGGVGDGVRTALLDEDDMDVD